MDGGIWKWFLFECGVGGLFEYSGLRMNIVGFCKNWRLGIGMGMGVIV